MFDIGFAELFLLALIGLLVLGPERLPGVARTVGGFVRKARASWNTLQHTIKKELDEGGFSEPIKQTKQEFEKIGKDLADIPSFNPADPESTTRKPQESVAEDQKPESVKNTDSGKDANV